MPIGSGLLAAAIPAVIGAISSMSNTGSTNAANMSLNQANMDWMTNMSNTAMQRRVVDLRSAGLNPLLAVSQGGASTPGFSPIAMQSAAPSISAAAGQVSNAAMQSALVSSQADLNTSNARLADAQARNQPTQGALWDSQRINALADAGLKGASVQEVASRIGLNEQETQKIINSLPGVDAESHISSMNAGIMDATFTHLAQAADAKARASMSDSEYQIYLNTPTGRLIRALGPGAAAGGIQAGMNAKQYLDALEKGPPDTPAQSSWKGPFTNAKRLAPTPMGEAYSLGGGN